MFLHQFRLYSRLLFWADILVAFPALLVAYQARHTLVRWVPLEVSGYFNLELLPLQQYFLYLVAFLPIWMVTLLLTQKYGDLLRCSSRRQTARFLSFLLTSASLMGTIIFVLKLEVSRPIFLGFLILISGLLPLNRVLLHWVLRSRNINEHNQIRILIVGTDERALRVAEIIGHSRKWGYHVTGLVARDNVPADVRLPIVGTLAELPELLLEGGIADELIFTGRRDLEESENVIALCGELGIRTRVAADFFPESASRVSLEFLDNLPLMTFSTIPEASLAIVAKRLVDFLVAAVSLVLLLPLLLLTALAIRFTSPGPIFYSQVRCGLYGRRFRLVKFRTMIEGAEDQLWEIRHLNEMDGPVFKMRNDPRVTPLGQLLRKFSIDELPQLWNVIKGEMSIVGPRAPLPQEVRHYSIPQKRRLSVKPGITCLWQVAGRSDVDFQKWMEMDLHYIDNWSFWLDLQIMLKTIPAVFSGRGAR